MIEQCHPLVRASHFIGQAHAYRVLGEYTHASAALELADLYIARARKEHTLRGEVAMLEIAVATARQHIVLQGPAVAPVPA